MPADGPVDVNRQTIHALIPGLDCRAAKQIDKLKRLTIIGYGIAYLLDQYNIVTLVIVAIITLGVYLSSSAYLVRKWSKEWNKKFERP